MSPITQLFVAAVDIHRNLMPMLAGVPGHRRLIREALGTPEGDLDFIRERFEASRHPDAADVDAAALCAWLPANALPLPAGDMVNGCR